MCNKEKAKALCEEILERLKKIPGDLSSKKALTHYLTFLWNTLNNSPIYFNTLDQLLWRLEWIEKRLSAYEGGWGKLGFASMLACLAGFTLSNQMRYADELYRAKHPSEPPPPSSSNPAIKTARITIDVAGAISKITANTGSLVLITQRVSGTILTGIVFPFTLLGNFFGNVAFYLEESDIKLFAHQSANFKRNLRLFSGAFFSISASAVYFDSADWLLHHIGASDHPCSAFENKGDAIFTSFNILLSVFILLPVTWVKYNQKIGSLFAEDKTKTPFYACFERYTAHLVLIAALFKTTTSASSAYAASFTFLKKLIEILLTLIIVSASIATLGLIPGGFVQWGLLKPRASALTQRLLDSQQEDQFRRPKAVRQTATPRVSVCERFKTWCSSCCGFFSTDTTADSPAPSPRHETPTP